MRLAILPQVENEIPSSENDGKLRDVTNEKALKSSISETQQK